MDDLSFIFQFFENFWQLSLSIGVYVLLGLFFVGIVHLYIKDSWIEKHLGSSSRYGALKGAIYGIPLPLCSCGVIPLASSLREKGASKKAVTSFFITTPMTGVDSIIATYGVFGLPMAILRVISSFLSGVLAGSLVKESIDFKKEASSSCCNSSCCESGDVKKENSFQKAISYALGLVFADIAKPMLFGLVLAALFMMVIPNDSIVFLNENIFLSYLLVFLVALPLYVCSISAIPIALSMLSLGITPGVAFIFLAAAPATNIITVGIIKKVLGGSVLFAYLGSIIITTLLFALLIDFVLPIEWFLYVGDSLTEESSWLESGGAIIFLGLLFYFFLKRSR